MEVFVFTSLRSFLPFFFRLPSTSRPPTGTPGTAALCTTSTRTSPTSTWRLWSRSARSVRTTTGLSVFCSSNKVFVPQIKFSSLDTTDQCHSLVGGFLCHSFAVSIDQRLSWHQVNQVGPITVVVCAQKRVTVFKPQQPSVCLQRKSKCILKVMVTGTWWRSGCSYCGNEI